MPASLKLNPMRPAHELVRRVADSGAEAHQALGGGRERQGRAFENGENGSHQLAVRFKRVPVAPTTLRLERSDI